MFARVVVVIVFLFALSAWAAPATLDAETLLLNAVEAQEMNVFYNTLSPGDNCIEGQKACVNGAPALCIHSSWTTSNSECPMSQSCYALPSVRKLGTVIACTSKAVVDSVLSACGVSDIPNPSSSVVSSSTHFTSSSPASSQVSVSITHASSKTSMNMATITVTLQPTGTVTLPPTTSTIAPDAASKLIASMLAHGGHVKKAQAPFP